MHAASVPPSSSIEDRAAKLSADISAAVQQQHQQHQQKSHDGGDGAGVSAVNIIAHSMGGLDARYMISRLAPPNVKIASLVTIATPHHGSSFADSLLNRDPPHPAPIYLPNLYRLISRTGLSTAAFSQLTTEYMRSEFNPATPDGPHTRYFSFGASTAQPGLLSPFRPSWRIIEQVEGPNDGLVSVESSQWGDYRGTLVDVSHLDLINWTNRVKWAAREWVGMKRPFNAIALYLDIADMLAKEGL